MPQLQRILSALLVISSGIRLAGATFGSVTVIGGHASDIALDERRGRLYIANFGGRRVDVMSTGDGSLQAAISVPGEPGSVALSPDNRYLLVTNYDNCAPVNGGSCNFLTPPTAVPQITIVDLDANSQRTILIPAVTPATTPPTQNIPLAMAFGKGSSALLVTSGAIFLVDPNAGSFTQMTPPQVALTSLPLPTSYTNFPPQIQEASAGVSGDGKVIFVLAQASAAQGVQCGNPQLIIRYDVPSGVLSAALICSVPALGPRVVSVDGIGANVLAGWAIFNPQYVLLAEFPYPSGALSIGGHAYDFSRNLIYAQVPTGTAGEAPVLHVLDNDNLTVRERIQLPENLAGRTLFSSDMNTLYAISDSGVMTLPVGSFAKAARVSTLQEQLLFLATSCDNGALTQTLDIVDLGGGSIDFTLSLPAKTNGVKLSQTSGTTPAKITIQIDPTAFRTQTGTNVVALNIQSNKSIGIPNQVRLLINTKDPDQRGIIHSVPGKIVDVMTDAGRGRMYAIRQDRNQVLVMDGSNFNLQAVLRTGNTPMKMTMTRDNRYLMVGNDHSQIASVFDLETMQAAPFIVFPFGHYPRSIAAANGAMFAAVRNAGTPAGLIDQVDFANRIATTPNSLGIYLNNLPPDAVMTSSASGGSIFTAVSDGTVLLYDDTYSAFEVARKDLTSLSGSYAAISDNQFLAGNTIFNRSMVPIGTIAAATVNSSILPVAGNFLSISADAPAGPGTAQRVSLQTTAVSPVRVIEAPVNKTLLATPTVGQIGQSIFSLLQTTAMTNGGSILYLSVSGFTELLPSFDQAVPLPSVSGVVNSADGGLTAPGSLITISGVGLAAGSGAAGGLPLPTSLAETCAVANSVAIPLVRVSASRIDAQLPYEVSGPVNMVITTPAGKSPPFSFTAPTTAAAIYRTGQAGDFTGLPLIYRAANNQLVDNSNPIRPGDVVLIIATGLGQTSPAAVSGAAASSNPLENALSTPTVSLNGTPLQVAFAGLIPTMVGLYQINAVVPNGMRDTPQAALVIQQGATSATFTVRVVSP